MRIISIFLISFLFCIGNSQAQEKVKRCYRNQNGIHLNTIRITEQSALGTLRMTLIARTSDSKQNISVNIASDMVDGKLVPIFERRVPILGEGLSLKSDKGKTAAWTFTESNGKAILIIPVSRKIPGTKEMEDAELIFEACK